MGAKFIVYLDDVNEAPVYSGDAGTSLQFGVEESAGEGDTVGLPLEDYFSDPEGELLSYRIVEYSPGAADLFSVERFTGQLRTSTSNPDWSVGENFRCLVNVSDGFSASFLNVIITVTSSNSAPLVNDTFCDVYEDASAGDVVCRVKARDMEGHGMVFSLPSTSTFILGAQGGRYKYNATLRLGNATVKIADGVALNFEETPEYNVTLAVTDDSDYPTFSTATIHVNVVNTTMLQGR